MRDAYAHCEAEVRAADKDRFLATLFAPAALRPHMFALYAFNAEIARVRERARGPLAGEIRLQYWRDVLASADAASGNPVAQALLHTVEQFGLPRDELVALIDAREFDLYDEPMPTLTALEDYARATVAPLFTYPARLLARSGAPPAAVATSAAIAYALTGLLRAFPFHLARGQLYVPRDVLARHDSNVDEVRNGTASIGVRLALAELREQARHHLAIAKARLAGVRPEIMPAFLSLALVEPYLERMERTDYDPFRTRIEIPQWRRQWLLWRAARWGF